MNEYRGDIIYKFLEISNKKIFKLRNYVNLFLNPNDQFSILYFKAIIS